MYVVKCFDKDFIEEVIFILCFEGEIKDEKIIFQEKGIDCVKVLSMRRYNIFRKYEVLIMFVQIIVFIEEIIDF